MEATSDKIKNIEKFFYPKSICLVGASTKEKSIGYELLRSIKTYGYKGEVFPVNPKADEILGYKCFHTIAELKTSPDLGIIVTPKQFVEESIKSLIAKGTKAFVLVTAGFKETGKEGEEAEKRIKQIIADANGNLVGPNCMGVINTLDEIKLNATFVAEKPRKGAIAFLSQSGALGAAVLNSLRTTDVRFAHFVSVGNKADLTENEFTLYWNRDPNVRILTYYLESFENGFEFLLPFLKGEIEKPAIVLKAGRTSAGMKAASSHTGALGSKDAVVDAILKQFGVVRAEEINELFNIAKGFEHFNIPKGNKIGVVTNAGGPAILTVDSLEKEGLKLAELSSETKKKLREIVHPNGSVNNPVDLLPGGTAENYFNAIQTVLEDENVDAVISIFVEPVMVEPMGVVQKVNSINSNKPIFQIVMPLPEFWDNYRQEKFVKPLFRRSEEPAKVISKMLFYKKKKEELQKNRNEYLQLLNVLTPSKSHTQEFFLSPKETKELLRNFNLPLIEETHLTYEELNKKEDFDFPLVIKGFADQATHKTELEGVKLNIKNKNELLEAAEEIKTSFSKFGKNLNYFVVQPFVKSDVEVFVGGIRDVSFGPVVMFGSGGKYVEVLKDVAIRSALLSNDDAEAMISETKIGIILKGVRGEKERGIKELKELLKATALLMLQNPDIVELDFNPVLLKGNKPVIVDVRIKLAK